MTEAELQWALIARNLERWNRKNGRGATSVEGRPEDIEAQRSESGRDEKESSLTAESGNGLYVRVGGRR